MTYSIHEIIAQNTGFATTNRFNTFVNYTPLTPQEFRSLSTNDLLQALPDDKLDRLWLRPMQRMLQQVYRIDQRSYSTTTDPTLADLDEDFKVAAAITIDKFARNEDEIIGDESISGIGNSKNDLEIPQRARQLLHRYERSGGRIGRA